MSGIFGILRTGVPAGNADLQGMARAMARRGPDGVNTWRRNGIGLGHCMLWSTPESLHETPPVISRDGQRVLCADVRLDNREQLLSRLRDALDPVHRPPAEIGDHALILAAYEQWGTECAGRLLGDFAFAIWDETNQSLFCARDHFGSKPFCYFHSGRLFAFASEVKALLAIADLPVQVNEPRVADYLFAELEGVDQTSTFYRNIFRLPPATWMVVNRAGVRQSRYWRLDPTRSIRLKSDAEYTEAFRDLFTQAVDCRLRSHKPPAGTLSGGIDSSAIVAVARDLCVGRGRQPLHTVSAVSDAPGNCIESQAVQAVIGQGNLLPHLVRPSELSGLRAGLQAMVDHCDDLFALPGLGVPLACYCTARGAGINVVLDGVDADLAASHGSHYLAYLLRDGQWKDALHEAVCHSRDYYRGTLSPASLLWRHGRTAFVPHGLRRLLHPIRARQRLQRALDDSIINRSFAREVDLSARLGQLDAYLRAPLPNTLREAQARLLDRSFITAALERYDRQASSQSIEARHPYFDIRLVEFCLALPWNQRIRDGYPKALLRRAMDALVPEWVRWRIGGWEHLGKIFNPQWEVMQWPGLKSALAEQREVLKRYVEPDILQRLVAAERLPQDNPALRDQLMTAGTLARWLGTLPR